MVLRARHHRRRGWGAGHHHRRWWRQGAGHHRRHPFAATATTVHQGGPKPNPATSRPPTTPCVQERRWPEREEPKWLRIVMKIIRITESRLKVMFPLRLPAVVIYYNMTLTQYINNIIAKCFRRRVSPESRGSQRNVSPHMTGTVRMLPPETKKPAKTCTCSKNRINAWEQNPLIMNCRWSA